MITDADREVAASFLENWEPGPEMTVVKLARAFATHRIAAMIEGARLMREAILPEIKTDRTIEKHGGHCRCVTCELNITEDEICSLDPATVIKEAE